MDTKMFQQEEQGMVYTDENGKQWEFKGEYRIVRRGDSFLAASESNQGRVVTVLGQGSPFLTTEVPTVERAIMHPVRRTHRLGTLELEETGEQRVPVAGDWYFDTIQKRVYYSIGWPHSIAIILRPTRVVEE